MPWIFKMHSLTQSLAHTDLVDSSNAHGKLTHCVVMVPLGVCHAMETGMANQPKHTARIIYLSVNLFRLKSKNKLTNLLEEFFTNFHSKQKQKSLCLAP